MTARRSFLTSYATSAPYTWNEIGLQTYGNDGKRRPKHHSQGIDSLCREAKERIAQLHHDETFGDEVYRFRLANLPRLWGYRVDETFYVLWWDPDHKV